MKLDQVVAPLPEEVLVVDAKSGGETDVIDVETTVDEAATAATIIITDNSTSSSAIPVQVDSERLLEFESVSPKVDSISPPQDNIQSKSKKKRGGGFWQLVAPDPNFVSSEEEEEHDGKDKL